MGYFVKVLGKEGLVSHTIEEGKKLYLKLSYQTLLLKNYKFFGIMF
jgi:hypothetical protein